MNTDISSIKKKTELKKHKTEIYTEWNLPGSSQSFFTSSPNILLSYYQLKNHRKTINRNIRNPNRINSNFPITHFSSNFHLHFWMGTETCILSVKEHSPSGSHLFLLYSLQQSSNSHHKLVLSILVLKREFPELC